MFALEHGLVVWTRVTRDKDVQGVVASEVWWTKTRILVRLQFMFLCRLKAQIPSKHDMNNN